MDSIITLLGENRTGRDDLGQPIIVSTRKKVYANIRSITRSEYYGGAMDALRPELAADIHAFEYSGERLVEVDGETYSVTREYRHIRGGLSLVELTLTRRAQP